MYSAPEPTPRPLPFLLLPDVRLRAKAAPVGRVTAETRDLAARMLHAIDGVGVGLAAPQLGVMLRTIVVDVGGLRQAMHDPVVTWASEETRATREGCLSIPGAFEEVERPSVVRVRYLGDDGREREEEVAHRVAVVVQHEVDHLDGILFVDRVSPMRRRRLLRRYEALRLRETRGAA